MAKPRDKLAEVSFSCPERHRFKAEPDRIEDAPDRPWHPWRYFARCPECGQEAKQAAWEWKLLKAYTRATGPRTPEGIARTSQNLVGHPTPEEAKRTRFNGLKHGLTARVATYWPARPGHYPECNGCEHLETLECKEMGACLSRADLFMRHHIAFENGDPKHLLSIRSDTQAALQTLIDNMIRAIAVTGVEIKTPEWIQNPKTGEIEAVVVEDPITHQLRAIENVRAHPLLNTLIDYVSRNSLTLADQGMTPKVQEDREILEGYLERDAADRDSLDGFQRAQQTQLERMAELIERSRERTRRDPVLIEYQGEDPDAGAD